MSEQVEEVAPRGTIQSGRCCDEFVARRLIEELDRPRGVCEYVAIVRRASAALPGALDYVRRSEGAGEYRERASGLIPQEAGDRPAADHTVHNPIHIRTESAAAAKRSLPDPIGIEHVPAIEIRAG